LSISISNPTVTFSGVASGLDTDSIISALLDVAHRPIGLLERERGNLQAAQKVWSGLDDKIDELEGKVRKLKMDRRLLANSTKSSDTDVLTASATGTAQEGSYAVTVGRLATAGSVGSQTYADTDTLTVGTGTVSVTVGTTTTDITIGSGDDTLQGIADAINSSDAEVTASVIATEPGGAYKLVVSGDETGEDNDVSVDVSGLSGGTQALTMSTLQSAQDSQITVNGLTVERGSNTITDVIEGMDLSLVSEGTSTVTVTLDTDAVKETLQEFVDAYNDVNEIMRAQLSYDSDSGAAAPPLLGDSSLRGIQRQLRTILGSSIDVGGGQEMSLSLMGIKTQTDGSLSITASDLEDALDDDIDAFSTFFTQADTGFAALIDDVLDRVTDPVDGTIQNRQDGISLRIESINDNIDRQQDRLDAYEDTLRKKFAGFEELMGQLQAQGDYLSRQLLQGSQ
jgi:flagellar hook-associated protein 2